MVLSGYSASSTTKTGRHDTAEILLKVMLSTKNQIKSNLINADIKSTGVPDTFLYIFFVGQVLLSILGIYSFI